MMHALWRYLQGRKPQSPEERREDTRLKNVSALSDRALKNIQALSDEALKNTRILSKEEAQSERTLIDDDLREARESVDRLRQHLAVISRQGQR
jgi:hypothetical protein